MFPEFQVSFVYNAMKLYETSSSSLRCIKLRAVECQRNAWMVAHQEIYLEGRSVYFAFFLVHIPGKASTRERRACTPNKAKLNFNVFPENKTSKEIERSYWKNFLTHCNSRKGRMELPCQIGLFSTLRKRSESFWVAYAAMHSRRNVFSERVDMNTWVFLPVSHLTFYDAIQTLVFRWESTSRMNVRWLSCRVSTGMLAAMMRYKDELFLLSSTSKCKRTSLCK